MFEGSFKDVLSKIQECYKNVANILQEYFKGSSRKYQRVFHKSFKVGVSWNFHDYFLIMLWKCVSSKFCFAILLLPDSHRRYRSRVWACFIFVESRHFKTFFCKYFIHVHKMISYIKSIQK